MRQPWATVLTSFIWVTDMIRVPSINNLDVKQAPVLFADALKSGVQDLSEWTKNESSGTVTISGDKNQIATFNTTSTGTTFLSVNIFVKPGKRYGSALTGFLCPERSPRTLRISPVYQDRIVPRSQGLI